MIQPKPFIGRPSQYDLKAIAKDLIEWAQHPDSLKFTMFSAPRMLNLQRFSEWADKDDDFAEAYELAKQFLDINRFKAAAQEIMPENWYSKNERIYDPLHDSHYRKERKFESELRKEENSQSYTKIEFITNDNMSSGIKVPTPTLPV